MSFTPAQTAGRRACDAFWFIMRPRAWHPVAVARLTHCASQMKTSLQFTIFAILVIFAGHAASQMPKEFIDKTVPNKYPQLIDYLKTKGPLELKWTTQSKEKQSAQIQLSKDGSLVIEAMIPMGSASSAATTGEFTKVIMVDRDLNSTLDRLEATPPGAKKQIFDNPRDEGSLFLWYSTLSIVFGRSPCCQN